MRALEQVCTTIRHSPALRDAGWLWNRLRAPYQALLSTIAPRGLERVLNGSERVRVVPECRNLRDEYEPEVWKLLTGEVRPGDVVADVGANIGLFTIALARRVPPGGVVHAFEPDPENFRRLSRHCALNAVKDQVRLHRAAVGDRDGRISFSGGHGLESHIGGGPGSEEVDCVSLDSVFSSQPVDVLKIDVEGFEEGVLRGGKRLLIDESRAPRFLYIEVHPFAWEAARTTSDSLLGFLDDCRYEVTHLTGERATRIDSYGGIVARKQGRRR